MTTTFPRFAPPIARFARPWRLAFIGLLLAGAAMAPAVMPGQPASVVSTAPDWVPGRRPPLIFDASVDYDANAFHVQALGGVIELLPGGLALHLPYPEATAQPPADALVMALPAPQPDQASATQHAATVTLNFLGSR